MHRVCHRPVSLHLQSAPLKYHPRGYYCDFHKVNAGVGGLAQKMRRRTMITRSSTPIYAAAAARWYCTGGCGKVIEIYSAEYFSLGGVNRYPILLQHQLPRVLIARLYLYFLSSGFFIPLGIGRVLFYPIQFMGFP
jgi:hypothetical protein